jgi:hypothetical protein
MVWVTYVNDCTSTVMSKRAKDADKLEPKGMWWDVGVKAPDTQTREPPVHRSTLTHMVICMEHGKPL